MAFKEIERGTFGGRAAIQNSVRIWAKAKIARLMIANDIFAKIGSPNFLKIMIGSGEHQGFIALIPRNMPSAGSYKPVVGSRGKGLASIAITSRRLSVSDDLSATELPFEITEDGLIVDLRPALGSKPGALMAAE